MGKLDNENIKITLLGDRWDLNPQPFEPQTKMQKPNYTTTANKLPLVRFELTN